MKEPFIYSDVMKSFFDSVIRKGSDQAWVACLRFDFNDHDERLAEEPDPVGGFLTIACFAPKNYVHVLGAFSPRPLWENDFERVDWQPLACHDSCWRDGVADAIQSAFRQVADKAEKSFGKEPKDLSFHMRLQHIKSFDQGSRLLARGLAKDKRHGDLSIEQPALAPAPSETRK